MLKQPAATTNSLLKIGKFASKIAIVKLQAINVVKPTSLGTHLQMSVVAHNIRQFQVLVEFMQDFHLNASQVDLEIDGLHAREVLIVKIKIMMDVVLHIGKTIKVN